MTHIGLFEGIGGFSIAARWAGFETIAWCEIDKFCQTILKYHFPTANGHEDIQATDFSIYRGKCDVLTGGFPCQPFSIAGKRKGTNDNRFLWPEMLRAIREINPSWVIAENVRGLISQESGMVFERVLSDLEIAGYETQPFIIPACAVNAPHRRDRVWIVANRANARFESMRSGRENQIYEFEITANPNDDGLHGAEIRQGMGEGNDSGTSREVKTSELKGCAIPEQFTTDPKEQRFSKRDAKQIWKQSYTTTERYNCIPGWENFPTQSPICGRNDGLSYQLDGITFSKFREESIKAFGNAIVPQEAYQFFKIINEIENANRSNCS